MNQHNRQNFSFKKNKQLKKKINGNYRLGQWLKLSHWNKFGYLTLTAFIFTVVVTFLSPAWLSIGQSAAYKPLAKETNERLILAQEETQQPLEENQDLQEQIEEKTTEEKVQPQEEATEEEAQPQEEVTEEEVQPQEEVTEEAVPSEESITEEEVQPQEEVTEEAVPSEEELPFEEAKKSLEEEIDERYEEWESQKTRSEISHSISAIATILMTVVIVLLGSELFELPYKRLIILILGIITVLIQLNINIFLLEKSLAGYEILAEQGLTLKSKLESVNTDEELTEIREQFQELILESIKIE
jgi:chemotaxis protein histidine kinase CheA